MWSTENSDAEAILAFYNLKKMRKRSFSFPFLDLCLFGCLEREEKHGKSNETERRPVLSPPLLRARRRVWGGGLLGAGRPVPRPRSERSLGPRWGWLRLGASERDLGARARTPARRPARGSWPDARHARGWPGGRPWGHSEERGVSFQTASARTAGSPGSPRASRPRPAAGRCPPTPEHLGRSPAGAAWPTRGNTGMPGGWVRGGGTLRPRKRNRAWLAVRGREAQAQADPPTAFHTVSPPTRTHQGAEDALALGHGGHLLQRVLPEAQLAGHQRVEGQVPRGPVPRRGHGSAV